MRSTASPGYGDVRSIRLVIPAHSGFAKQILLGDLERRDVLWPWIPAFAGMTEPILWEWL
jgi:hypothetical protein